MPPIPLHHVWNYTEIDRAFWREHLQDWLPAEIFDAHTHVNEPRFRRETMTEEKRRQHWFNEVCEPIAAADAQRCHRSFFRAATSPAWRSGCPFWITISRPATPVCKRSACGAAGIAWRSSRRSGRPGALARTRPTAGLGRQGLLCLDRPRRDDPRQVPGGRHFRLPPHHQLELLDRRRAWVTLHVPKADRLGHPANIAEIRQLRRQYPRITW